MPGPPRGIFLPDANTAGGGAPGHPIVPSPVWSGLLSNVGSQVGYEQGVDVGILIVLRGAPLAVSKCYPCTLKCCFLWNLPLANLLPRTCHATGQGCFGPCTMLHRPWLYWSLFVWGTQCICECSTFLPPLVPALLLPHKICLLFCRWSYLGVPTPIAPPPHPNYPLFLLSVC